MLRKTGSRELRVERVGSEKWSQLESWRCRVIAPHRKPPLIQLRSRLPSKLPGVPDSSAIADFIPSVNLNESGPAVQVPPRRTAASPSISCKLNGSAYFPLGTALLDQPIAAFPCPSPIR